jgi:tetratricopeptide (TPR) repeat protein
MHSPWRKAEVTEHPVCCRPELRQPAARLLLAVLAFLALLPSALLSAPRWVKLQSPHFELFTGAETKEACRLLVQLENARTYFIRSMGAPLPAAPLRVVSFGSDEEFDSFRSSAFAAGLYVGTPGGDYIVLKHATAAYLPMAIHEYSHHVMRYSGVRAPLWWQEGVAEVFSTINFMSDRVEVGAVPSGRYNSLKGQEWIKISTLLGIDRLSAPMQDRRHAELVYAESWALVHMLLLSDEYGNRRDGLMKRIAAGAGAVETFRDLYGKTPDQVQADLESYVKQNQFGLIHSPVEVESPAPALHATEATAFELQLALANISLGVNRREQAVRILTSLSRQYPDRWEVDEALAYLSWYAADRDGARSYFGRAVEKGMANAKAYVHYAGLLGEVRAANSTLIPLVTKALELEPENHQASLKLASLYLRDRRYQEVISVVGQIAGIRPDEAFQAHLLQGYAHLGLGEIESARNAVGAAQPSARTEAESAELERLSRSVSAREPASQQIAPVSETAQPANPARIEPSSSPVRMKGV